MRWIPTIAASALFAGAAYAQDGGADATGVLDAVYSCASVSEADERLACYDAAVGALQAREQAGEVAVVDRERVREIEREAFGLSLPSLPRLTLPSLGGREAEPIETIQSEITDWSRAPRGELRFELANGQTWIQIDDREYRMPRTDTLTASISRASFGSFVLQVNDRGRNIRVRRVE